jgi:hypothetical protein
MKAYHSIWTILVILVYALLLYKNSPDDFYGLGKFMSLLLFVIMTILFILDV